jgi:aspartyl-tRNA synthetase
VSKIKGLAIGEDGAFRVTGKIVGLSQRERKENDKTIKTGSIELENFEVEVLGDEDNEFTKMSDED